MLTKMTTVLMESPSNTTQKVQVTARAVAGLTQRPDELSPAAQVRYCRTLQRDENVAVIFDRNLQMPFFNQETEEKTFFKPL